TRRDRRSHPPAQRRDGMSRRAAIVTLTAFLGFLVIVTTARGGLEGRLELQPGEPHQGDLPRRVVGTGQIRFDGAGPEKWALRFHREQAKVRFLRRELTKGRRLLLSQPTVSEAINLAGATYGNRSTLWRKARCEWGLNPRSVNSGSSASGLFQFLPSTWNSTPYAGFSILDPFAN